jgi:hypothetical protein
MHGHIHLPDIVVLDQAIPREEIPTNPGRDPLIAEKVYTHNAENTATVPHTTIPTKDIQFIHCGFDRLLAHGRDPPTRYT